MSAEGLAQAQDKMREAGVAPAAIDVFTHYYGELEAGATGLVLEETIEPLLDPDKARRCRDLRRGSSRRHSEDRRHRLNGGLGTSMGMDKAKSLLPVRDGKSFLDIIAAQVLHAREAYGARLPLVLMNSFRTQDDSLEEPRQAHRHRGRGPSARLPPEPRAQGSVWTT
ncbi:hypothetical protein GCM10025876_20710 [Demequina litorisediminis]|uniref:UTP--glucose-1-phosphate uridylyltransferase n=1 Tax=Demequina litorisediminis TaxID=1849022 RepID=A0ABQ6IFD6_9MICO|nr:hypothetical protein GCM10025876_20710 [Demequina litorisediminis]